MNKKTLVIIFIISLLIGPTIELTQNYQLQRAFSVSILVLDDSSDRIEFASYLKEIFEFIGIGVTNFDVKSRNEISLRSWSYPMIDYDYIPTYQQGGYDIIFLGREGGLDLNLHGFYETAAITPNGNNFYQYSNPTFDALLAEYMEEFDKFEKSRLAEYLQAILYEDQPDISLSYLREVFCFRNESFNIDPTLILKRNHRAEYWNSSKDTKLIYSQPDEFTKFNCFRIEYDQFNDPIKSDALWSQCVYASLFQRGQVHHNWEPVIAQNYSAFLKPSNKINLTVDINSNATFSNGESVLAEDVVYTYQLHLTPDVNSTAYDYLTDWFQSNSSISVKDVDRVEFLISRPYSHHLKLLSFGIVDKSEIEPLVSLYGYDIFNAEPFSADLNDSLVTSCGPFKMANYNLSNQAVKLVPNEFWSGLTPYFDEITFNRIQGKNTVMQEFVNNHTDIIDSKYNLKDSDFENIEDLIHVYSKSFYTEIMAINFVHPFLGTGELTPVGTPEAAKWLRKGISHAIPRQYISDELIDGKAVPGVTSVPEGCVEFCEDLEHYRFDIDLVIDYMQDSGLTSFPFSPFARTHIIKEEQKELLITYSTIFSFLACSFVALSRIFRKKK
ncbi:MAG: ABC transporter substrate-binding protein [Candidatus Heimdallarchaeaceae archaeon]|jgi:ABC-type transport system substrate-binding protein